MIKEILLQLLSAIRFAVLVVIEQNMSKFKLPPVSENAESKALVKWVELEHGDELMIFHIANEVPVGLSAAQAKHRHAMGVRPGAPDYLVVNRHTHKVCFVELKRRKGGRNRKAQKICIAALGRRARFCKGWHKAAEFIEETLLP